MNIKRAWAFQSFITCFLVNSIFAGLVFLMADKIMEGLREWLAPFAGQNLPENLRTGVDNIGVFLSQLHQYMAPALAALAFAATLLLWLFVFLLGRRLIGRAAAVAEFHDPETRSSDGTERSV